MRVHPGVGVGSGQSVHRRVLDGLLAGRNDYAPFLRTFDIPDIIAWDDDGVDAEWRVSEAVHHSGGAVFGGYTAMLADRFAGLALFPRIADDETFRTADLRVSFLRPIRDGTVAIRAVTLSKGAHVAHTRVTFVSHHGHVLATADATQIIVPFRRPGADDGTAR